LRPIAPDCALDIFLIFDPTLEQEARAFMRAIAGVLFDASAPQN
jgi:hypothetical protein